MRAFKARAVALGLSAFAAAFPVHANRMTFEVWPDAVPDHTVSCTVALDDGWITLVHVTGAGMPGLRQMRWRASQIEVEALIDSLQAFVGGDLGSVEVYAARQPAPPFLSVTWMTRLDDRLATGLYLQKGLALPRSLQATLASLGVARVCGVSATTDE